MRVTVSLAPSEQRTGELEQLRGEVRPLNTATGLVIAGSLSILFWALVYLACRTI